MEARAEEKLPRTPSETLDFTFWRLTGVSLPPTSTQDITAPLTENPEFALTRMAGEDRRTHIYNRTVLVHPVEWDPQHRTPVLCCLNATDESDDPQLVRISLHFPPNSYDKQVAINWLLGRLTWALALGVLYSKARVDLHVYK